MTTEQFIQRAEILYTKLHKAGEHLKRFPRKANGLTPDHVRSTIEYRAAKNKVDSLFAQIKVLNKQATKKQLREYRDWRKNNK